MNMKSTANRQKQLGLSLIELLISMTLSIMLLGAVMQVFISTQLTYNLTGDTSRIQENGRFSLDYMTQSLRMAHYLPTEQATNASPPDAFLQTDCGSFSPCTTDGGTNAADRIAVVFEPPSLTDCTGATVLENEIIANVFYITADDDGLNSLTCRGFNVTNNGWMGEEQPLIDGIDNMQVLYGINSTDDGVNVTQYISANDVTDWSAVASVRLGLLVSAGGQAGKGELKTRKYVLLDSTEISIQDKNTRQIYSTTIALNNIVFTDS